MPRHGSAPESPTRRRAGAKTPSPIRRGQRSPPEKTARTPQKKHYQEEEEIEDEEEDEDEEDSAEEDDDEDLEEDEEDEAEASNSKEERKFKCPYCKQAFSRKYDMEKHSRKHTGDKPYKV